ncbi:hypothetical protein Sango_0023600 [Sesamum angolense]|uniref:Uncharacterized protein n=1 Tax=Sesamum angolense TaxID=2727404 RepID=A0AAE2C593_9LAMI|nr:hypothetical protein Sango_0023600 [Sesamum angolense]
MDPTENQDDLFLGHRHAIGEVKGDQYTTPKCYVDVIRGACDLVGIDPSVVVHMLNLNPTFPPVKKKKRHFGLEKDKVIQEEGYHEIMLNPKHQKCYKPKLSGQHISNTTGVKYEREMKPHVNLNEVQRLAGRIAALSRFISRATEYDLPFFKGLRKTKNFAWDEACQQAFQDLKTYLAKLRLLAKLTLG